MLNIINKYNTFLKYIVSASISFVVDIALFTVFSKILFNFVDSYSIIVSTIIARAISSLINYLLNKNKVFKYENNQIINKKTLVKYFALVIIQMCVSAFLVWIIHEVININASIIKIFVDLLIFIINYFVQKLFIFKK